MPAPSDLNRSEGARRIWTAALASLIPWAAFLLATVVADNWVDYKSTSLGGLAVASPFYLGAVALPSMLALLAARAGVMQIVVLVLLTLVAAVAGVLVMTTDDAQAGLAVLWVPYAAIPVAAVAWVGQAVAARRTAGPASPVSEALGPARISDRLAAMAIDTALLGAVLVVPLTALSGAKQEVVAGLVGVAVGTTYLAVLVAGRGRTVGHSLVGIAVVDAPTRGPVTPGRALARSLIVVLELAAAAVLFVPPAIAELIAVASRGRSLTDMLVRTSVVRTR